MSQHDDYEYGEPEDFEYGEPPEDLNALMEALLGGGAGGSLLEGADIYKWRARAGYATYVMQKAVVEGLMTADQLADFGDEFIAQLDDDDSEFVEFPQLDDDSIEVLRRRVNDSRVM